VDFNDDSLIIKSNEMHLRVDAIASSTEDLIKFESKIDFEMEFKMTPGDAVAFYDPEGTSRTFVENAIRVVKFKLGKKVDLKPVCGHFTEDTD